MSTQVNVDLASPNAQQDKDATRAYSFDVTGMIPAGDTVTGCAWTVPAALTKVADSFAGNVCSVTLSGGVPMNWYPVVGSFVTNSGASDQIVLQLFIKADAEGQLPLGSALFPNRFTAVAALRADRLLQAGMSVLPNLTVSDDYLWDKLRAAEAQVAHALRVPLRVTQFFPADPTQAQLDALPLGMPWEIDPGYDYDPDFFRSDRWGFIALRKKPLDSVSLVRILFPAAGAATSYNIPADWLRLDKKYGQVQFVPISGTGGIALNAFMLQALGMGRQIPFAIQVTYRAGLANAARDYPDLLDVVQKEAVMKVMEDRFLPQSGSISADGLSQSVSIDMDKYRETADYILNGPKGRNGGLMAAIHGVRMMVM